MVIIKNHCVCNENKYVSYNIEYPQFNKLDIEDFNIEIINKVIHDEVYSFIDVLEQEAKENEEYIFVFIDSKTNINKNYIVSISVKFMYTSGNKYLTEYIKTYNYDFNSKKTITLKDLFKKTYDYKNIINKYIKNNLEDINILENQTFYINENSINLCFSAFEVYEDCSGTIEIEIPFKPIEKYLNEHIKNYIMEG